MFLSRGFQNSNPIILFVNIHYFIYVYNQCEYQPLTKKHPTHNACKWGAYHNKNRDYLSTI